MESIMAMDSDSIAIVGPDGARISDYGNTVWLRSAGVGHAVSPDMRRLINKYFENNYDTTY